MTAKEPILWLYRKHCKEPDLADMFSRLIEEVTKLGYEVFFGPDYQNGFQKSSHDKGRRYIFLDTDTETGHRPPSGILISFAHEYGHIQDPITELDEDMNPENDMRMFCLRQKERELAAWNWAEEWFRNGNVWPRLHQEFAEQKTQRLADYQKKWNEHGISV